MMLGLNLNSFNFWVNLIVSLGFLVGIVFGAIKTVNEFVAWWHRKIASVATGNLASEIEEIKKQYQPNSGSTLRDAVDRIEATVHKLDRKLDMVQSELDRHLGAHEGL